MHIFLFPGDDVSLTCEEELENPIECASEFQPMSQAQGQIAEEYIFWERMRTEVLGLDVNKSLQGLKLANGLRTLRNKCLLSTLFLNALWLLMLSMLYFYVEDILAKVNIYGLIAAIVYGMVLVVQLLGMSIHRMKALFNCFGTSLFGAEKATWIHPRNRR